MILYLFYSLIKVPRILLMHSIDRPKSSFIDGRLARGCFRLKINLMSGSCKALYGGFNGFFKFIYAEIVNFICSVDRFWNSRLHFFTSISITC